MRIRLGVEDDLSEAVLRRLISELRADCQVEFAYPPHNRAGPRDLKSGWGYLQSNLTAFALASKTIPHVVLVDLDDSECAPMKVKDWLSKIPKAHNLMLRIAVTEVESWLLADFDGLMEYLHVPNQVSSQSCETIRYPKEVIVAYASKSRLGEIKRDMCPLRERMGAVGPGYQSLMRSFARDVWNFEEASKASPSLSSAIAALAKFKKK
jgi:hypothetical protein